MVLSKKSCPVPLEQQPLEEYASLIMSKFFSLPAKEIKSYFLLLFSLSISLILLGNLLFFPDTFLFYLDLKSFFTLLIISDIILIFIIMRLYFSWSYVSKRLLSAIVFYEESGWYDGQIWVKTTDVLMQDRLIAMNISVPLINRVKSSMFVFFSKIVVEIAILSHLFK
nr:Ycf36 [Erythrotrichia foliiformis]